MSRFGYSDAIYLSWKASALGKLQLVQMQEQFTSAVPAVTKPFALRLQPTHHQNWSLEVNSVFSPFKYN